MSISIVALLLALIGLALYLVTDKAKPAEIGRIMFFVGLFWLVSTMLAKSFQLG